MALKKSLSRILGLLPAIYNVISISTERTPDSTRVIYPLAVLLPFGMKVLMRMAGSEASLVELVGIYAYSFISFLPACLLCAIPVQGVQVVAILYAAVTSIGFLFVTYFQEFKRYEGKTKILALAGICVA